MAYAVIAEFKVKPGCLEQFLEVAREDAEHSVRDEEGCLVFDVNVSAEDENTVILYEVYTSREAFDAHLKTPHLAKFRENFPPLIEDRVPGRFLNRVYP
ncbi:antibiotic biosynthesis monooxygenase [Rhodobacteraceae bacterium RKSG542]|uniref:putative quinol monooxygenase n=1 Tax=Pseudovibrio flavus TaxID=2529854 RepID=UPI0012BD2E84|nr:putative quinol monooxygenase [Pseudovibrio flavus]MTI16251.1 antibiotic biosynthesis monooxygenase [Pseudovibrio flavus]